MTEGRVSGCSATHRPDGRSPALSNVFGTPKQCPHGSGYSDLFPHAIIYGRIFAGQPRARPTGAGPRRWKFLRIHTVWSRTTKFGTVTHLWKRFDAAAAQEGRTPAFPRSWNPIRPHEMTEPRTLHGDQSWWQENFYRVDHAMLLDDVLQRLLMFIDTKYTLLRK